MEFRAKPLGYLGAKLREIRYYRVLYELSIELILGVNAFSGIAWQGVGAFLIEE